MTHHSRAAGANAAIRRLSVVEDTGTPLAEYKWSESIIGIGFHPEEVGLPDGWTWQQDRVAREADPS
jgi:hypothetical protein